MKFELLGQGEGGVIVPFILNLSKIRGVVFENQNYIFLDKEKNNIFHLEKDRTSFTFQDGRWEEQDFSTLVKTIAGLYHCESEDDNGDSIVFRTSSNEHRIYLKEVIFIIPEYVKILGSGFEPTLVIEMVENKRTRISIGSDYMSLMHKVVEAIGNAHKPTSSQTIIEIEA